MRPKCLNITFLVISLIDHNIFKLTPIYVFIDFWRPFRSVLQLLGGFFYLPLRSQGVAISVEFWTCPYVLLYLPLFGFVLLICLWAYYLSPPLPLSLYKSRKAGSHCLMHCCTLSTWKILEHRKRWDEGEEELAMAALDCIANSKYSFTLTPHRSRRLTARSTSQWEMSIVETIWSLVLKLFDFIYQKVKHLRHLKWRFQQKM